MLPIQEMLEISDLVARRSESGIYFKNRLKRGEVTHEKSGGNTWGSGGPMRGQGVFAGVRIW